VGDFNVVQGGRAQSPGGDTVVVNHHANANQKGSWVELIAATAFDWKAFDFQVYSSYQAPGSFTSALTDIGIGGAGSEQVLLENLMSSPLANSPLNIFTNVVWQSIPLAIPAGTRIAARGQSTPSGGTKQSGVYILGKGGGFTEHPVLGRATTIGTDTASSRGTVVTTAASANGKGSWAQLTASAPHSVRHLMVMAARMNSNFCIDIGVGAAASEVVVLANLLANPNGPVVPIYPVAIPAGTRIAARASATVANQTLDVGLVLIG
jgi:hypothetical protein